MQHGPRGSNTYSEQSLFGDFRFLPQVSLVVRLKPCEVRLLGQRVSVLLREK